ncbi:hypothetical protein H6F75_22415 [Nodosilinea sp. FACHB-131]|uniref:hypothetical protein n=1 Tax=Leptolyngbya subtilissima TaxID=1346803 RepID=UPI0016821B50|nr:hypothetical protein [Nodosilinea sp. FACHB-131]
MNPSNAHNSENIKAAAWARLEIENAIKLLKANHAYLTEGQIKEIKRVIYSSPMPEE